MNLDKYVVGAKLAGKERLIFQMTTLYEQAKEDCVVLIIPKSAWAKIRQEFKSEPHTD